MVAAESNKKPYVTPELVEYLQKLYPDKAPDISTPDKEIWLRVGQVQVVRHLAFLLNQQLKDQMENGLLKQN